MRTQAPHELEPSDAPPIKLAQIAPFALGELEVHPATCRVTRGGSSESLEPRVMQVLVALAQARGEVVSRDDLILRCWEGRVVGENAINRVISRLRALGATLGAGIYELVTITKVGYRLIVAAPAPVHAIASAAEPIPPLSPRPMPGRRSLMAASVAAIAGFAVYGWRTVAREPSAEGLALYRKGVEAQRQGLAEQNVQAVAYFRQAVARDPEYAAAWGALALAYRHLLETGRPEDDPPTTADWVRSTASRAFELDPRNADARTALILIKPYFRNWTVMEREVRAALREYPGHWLLWSNLGRILGEVGRWRDAIEPFERAVALDPFLPLARARQAIAWWSSGDLQKAQGAFEAASARWPAHPAIWFPRFNFLALTGQPDAALAMAAQTGSRPAGMATGLFDAHVALANAIQGGPSAGGAAASSVESAASSLPTASAVPYLTSLGRLDEAFLRLDRYFLGPPVQPASAPSTSPGAPGSLVRRYTDFLFMPPVAALRADRRFDPLMESLGLESYWRLAAVKPDHRG